jgi:hypothetical protein
MASNSRKKNRKVSNEKGFFSKLYDGASTAYDDVSDWFEESGIKKSLMPGSQTAIDKINYKNKPVKNRPKDSEGKKTFKAFKKKEVEKRAKTKTKLDASKAARKVRKDARENKKPLVKKDNRKIEGLIWDEKLGVFRDNYGQVKKAGGKPDWKKSKVLSDTKDGKKVGLLRYPEESIIDVDKRVGKVDAKKFEGEISNEAFADQKVSDAQIDDLEGQNFDEKTMIYSDAEEGEEGFKRKSTPLRLKSKHKGGLSDGRIEQINKLFKEKDPEGELIATQHEQRAAIQNSLDKRGDDTDYFDFDRDRNTQKQKKKPFDPSTIAQDEFSPQSEEEAKKGEGFENEIKDAKKFEKLTEDPKDKKSFSLAEELLLVKGKDETARIRESSGNYYIDPYTGFALDLDVLSRSNKRAEIMDLAKVLPADKRAAFLYQKGVIKQADLDKMLEPSEKEQLDIDVKKAQLAEFGLNIVKKTLDNKNYRSPQEKEEFKMYGSNYRNAVTNDDFQGQMYWGVKLKMPKDQIKLLAKKGKSTGITSDVEKYWKKTYGHGYDLHNKRVKFQLESSKIFDEGVDGFEFDSKKYSGRKQFFTDNGLKEWNSVNSMLQSAKTTGDKSELQSYFKKFSIYPKTKDGSMDFDKLISKDDYNQFVARNFVHKAMGNTYGVTAYETMLRDYERIISSNPNYASKVINRNQK